MECAAAGFDGIAEQYDELFTNSVIGRAQRQAVWRELQRLLTPGQRVLEINCGTGVDAVFMANRGVTVDAYDASPVMIEVAKRRQGSNAAITFRVKAIEHLGRVDGHYDGALSNFGGLNCVRDLAPVAAQFRRLVRPGGFFLVCLAARFCAWELAWHAARGEFGTAIRRLSGEAEGRLGETVFRVCYPTAAKLARTFAPDFRIVRRRGIGVLVPPTYLEPWARRHPRALATAATLDRVLSILPLVRAAADHVLLVLERTRT
jgi:ubiquinone/menaquinone biosynthesis C-methylase UbiE